MVTFTESIERHLPVTAQFRPVGVSDRSLAEREPVHASADLAQVLCQGLIRLRLQVDEDKTLVHFQVYRRQSAPGFVEVVKHVLIRHRTQRPVRQVRPAMQAAGKGHAPAFLLPHQFVAAMRTHVVETAYLMILPAHDEDRCIGNGQVKNKVITRFCYLLNATNLQPGAIEQALFFQLVMRFGIIGFGRYGTRPQFGIAFGQAAFANGCLNDHQ